MTVNLFVIRHAESVPNVTPIIGGMRGDTGLTERGRGQARLLAARLRAEGWRADALYASTLPRALETASYVSAALDLPVIPDADLQELRPGEADGLPTEEWRRRYPRPGEKVYRGDFFDPNGPGYPDHPFSPGGESWTTFLARASAGLTRIVERHAGQRIVLVSHGGNLRVLFFLAFGLTALDGNGTRFEPTNTGISHWRYDAGPPASWSLVSFNDAAHLQAWANEGLGG